MHMDAHARHVTSDVIIQIFNIIIKTSKTVFIELTGCKATKYKLIGVILRKGNRAE